MEDGAVDAGGLHVAQRLVQQIGRRAMGRHDGSLGPQMDLRIDDLHERRCETRARDRSLGS